ncbi:hypothetical protein K2Y11_04780 [bacterium]|nr:hypothetical protein [bacterium]
MNDSHVSLTKPLTLSRNAFFWGFWWLLSAALVGYTWNVRPVMSPNDASRWDTVWSLVEYNTYEIFDTTAAGDKQQFLTIDKVVRRHDNKTISSKPPLLPTVIAGFVMAVKPIVGKPFTKDQTVVGRPTIPGSINIYAKLVLWVFQILPFMAAVYLFRRFLDQHARTDYAWILSIVTMGMGTLVTGYLVTLNNHVIAASFGFIATYHLVRIWYDGRQEWWRFALAGFCAGWTGANELPAGLFCAIAVIVVIVANWKRGIFAFLPPLGLVTIAFFYTNYLAVGDPAKPWDVNNFTPAYMQKDLYQTDASGQPSYWASKDKSGIDALNDHPEPEWLYCVHSFIGHHGLFSLSPILLFAAWGLGRNLMGRDKTLFGFGWPVLLVSVVVSVFYLHFNDQRNYGGFCHGLRWIQWMNLVWLMFLPFAIDALASKRWIVPVSWGALTISVLSVFDTWYSPWSRAWFHRILLFAGVIDY